MNDLKKILLPVFLILFLFTILYVPEEINGLGTNGQGTTFEGYVFVLDLSYEISLKMLFIEWFSLIILYFGLSKVFKSD
jgi:hypothetical protein